MLDESTKKCEVVQIDLDKIPPPERKERRGRKERAKEREERGQLHTTAGTPHFLGYSVEGSDLAARPFRE